MPWRLIDSIAQLGRKDSRYRNEHRHSVINVGGGVETVTAIKSSKKGAGSGTEWPKKAASEDRY